ncbi:hypothetical protein F4775DRAFT_74084 [Biscogniauxia sp. FL1348]|nr:hypothetical protein F4775DRAFT_74084 [Biscogniauxia sp. FL1348]
MSHPTASTSTPPTMAHDSHEFCFSSSQNSNADTSNVSFESSFRLEPGYPSQTSECEKHPKGKRKRTTSQDKAILEAAYSANPKPDKAARLDIVKRVSLNEKEVQIWFQNRRQNDRRKSRPLSPQEIAALRYGGGIHVLSSDPSPTSIDPVPAAVDGLGAVDRANEVSLDGRPADTRPSSPQHSASHHSSQCSSPRPMPASQEEIARSDVRGFLAATPQKDDTERSDYGLSQSLRSSASVGYMAGRWSLDSSFSTPATAGRPSDESFRRDSFQSAHSTAHSSPGSILPPPSSSSSRVRLSLSLDGKAELVSSQPSPPRPTPQPPVDVETLPPVRTHRTLQRSRSALPSITLPPISTLTAHLPPQLTRGRSRDVHAWESCCEADTRDELTKQAENESSGSAIAAISLLRSSSSSASLSNLIHNHSTSNVLQANPIKRNSPLQKSSSSLTKGVTKKTKLNRASSSIARMQTLSAASLEKLVADEAASRSTSPEALQFDTDKKFLSNKASLSVILSPSGDSDKENWSPKENGNSRYHYNDRHRPLAVSSDKAQDLPSSGPLRPSSKTPGWNRNGNPRRAGRVLGEHDGLCSSRRSLFGSNRANTAPVSGFSSRLRGGKPGTGASPLRIFEDGDEEETEESRRPRAGDRRDSEVAEFMRGEVSPSKKPDMDCVAGLLSLSQGNWR